MKTLVSFVLFLSIASFGQSGDLKKLDPPKPATLADAEQVKILKAQKAVSAAQAEMSNLAQQWQNLQGQAKTIQDKIAATQKALLDEVKSAANGIGLDPEKYDFNYNDLTFSPKVGPAPATPSPAKK